MARRSTSTASFIAAIFLSTTANAQTTWYVDIANCPGPGSGTQEDPFCKIQDGIDAGTDADECLVAPGTYNETINFNGKAISLRSSGGPDVTTIDANDSGSAVSCTSGEGQDTVLQGFTITGGDAISGGGMRNIGSSPTVDNCRFVENEAAVGAGMYNEGSSPTVTDCSFVGNSTAYGAGGGMANAYFSNPLLINCVFRQNTAGGYGGGLQSLRSDVTAINCKFVGNTADRGGGMKTMYGNTMLVNCRFEGNVASIAGGGVLDQSNNLVIINTIFTGNMADYGGGMYDGSDKNATVTNCTFVGNSANDNYGGAIRGSSAGTTTVTNCILWNNDGGSIGGISPTVTYSDIEGGFPGTGNIDAEPLFADPDNGDFQLSPGSPCIDAADNTGVFADTVDLDDDGDTDEPIPFDLDWNPRFVDDPDTPDTGHPDGASPIVDMGAYELQGPACNDDDGDGQVTICHRPPGNPANARTITVNVNAVPAHLAHGDICGSCEGDDGQHAQKSGGKSGSHECPGDVDGDGAVNTSDLAIMLGTWGPCEGCPADIFADGDVNADDLAILLGSWGPCP